MEKNYTISEYVELPSLGKVYDSIEVNPKVQIRSMTTVEEMRRLSHTDKAYKSLCDIIDDCLINDPGISAYDMALGDYQYLLFKLRTVTYGDEYKGSCTCPICGALNESSFSIDDLPVKTYTEEIEKYREFDLPVTKSRIKIRMRTPRTLDILNDKMKEFKAKKQSADSTILYQLQSVIEEIDGAAPNPVYYQDWLKKLPMRDTNTILQYSDKLDSMLGIDTSIIYTCDMCGLPFTSILKTDLEFFRPAVGF